MPPISLARITGQKGIVLVSVIALIAFLGLFISVGVAVVASSASTHSMVLEGTQAFAIAHAGAEWYMEQLQTDTDWSDETTQTKDFAQGQFVITIDELLPPGDPTEITFTSTGTVASTLTGQTMQRYVTLTAQKITPAFQFALFQGLDPGADFTLAASGTDPTLIDGDMWSRGSVRIDAPNSVQNGTVYYPDTETVTGTGSYTAQEVMAPYLVMPVMDASSYLNTMSGYDALLDANPSANQRTVNGGTFNINTDPDCSAGMCHFSRFLTRGNLTITGNGTINVNRDIRLHSLGGSVRLTISPDPGGSIALIANLGVEIGNVQNPDITVNSNCTFYSRSQSSDNAMIDIHGNQTSLNDATLMSRRRIRLTGGVDVTGDSLIFLDYPGSTTNNYVDISGGTGVTTVEGVILSRSRLDNGVRIQNGGTAKTDTVVTGLVYAYGDAVTGGCFLADATITGSVTCNRFQDNQITNVALTYDETALPSSLPEGFEEFIAKKPNSWDGF